MDKEKVDVDYEAYCEQNKQNILKTGQYVQLEVIVPFDENLDIYSNFTALKCTSVDAAKTIIVTQELIKSILKEKPFLAMLINSLDKNVDINGLSIVKKDDEDYEIKKYNSNKE